MMLHIQSLVFYCVVSMVMVFFSKYCMNEWKLDCIWLLVLIENSNNFFLTRVVLAKQRGDKKRENTLNTSHAILSPPLIQVSSPNETNKVSSSNNFNLSSSRPKIDQKYQILSAIFYSLHAITSLIALDGLKIEIYTIFKRCSPLANLVISFMLFSPKSPTTIGGEKEKQHNRKIHTSILMMTFGVIVAGIGDLEFDLKSYLYCGMSVICQSLYLSFVQKSGERSGRSSLETLNNFTRYTVPILFTFFFVSGEAQTVFTGQTTFKLGETKSKVMLYLLSLMGSCLVFSQFWCTLNNNAITTSVAGVLKSVIQTSLAIVFLQNVTEVPTLVYLGTLINICSGLWYTRLKYTQSHAEAHHHNQSIMKQSLSDANLDVSATS